MMQVKHAVVLLLIIIAGCKRRDNIHAPIQPHLRAITDWKPGSYWIMTDSASSENDSFLVTGYDLRTYEFDDETRQRLYVDLSRHNTVRPADSTHWQIMIEYGASVHVYFSTPDSAYSFENYYLDTSSTAHLDATFNGKSYRDVFLNEYGGRYGTTGQLAMALNEEYGLIMLRTEIGTYPHTWYLSRQRIVRN